MLPSMTPANLRRRLLAWYRRAGRHDLPWRRDWGVYSVLVSELMLQQTTVATVIPYFHRFLARFPTLGDLAAAPLEEVRALWSGLGYYARAKNLQSAAVQLVSRHGGRLPRTRADVEDLPGVGPYTAGALLSFVHDQPEALVDGNVVRVLSRLYGLPGHAKDPTLVQRVWDRVRTLVPPGGARHFNSALMDLGATVCRPAAPACALCPWATNCRARSSGNPEDVPAPSPKTRRRAVRLHLVWVTRGGSWLLIRRAEGGLYAGLPEPPVVEGEAEGDRLRRTVEKRLGLTITHPERRGRRRHILSHREIDAVTWRAQAGPGRSLLGQWHAADEVSQAGLSALVRSSWRLLS
jgi:A/G-specific adenine glycosylase